MKTRGGIRALCKSVVFAGKLQRSRVKTRGGMALQKAMRSTPVSLQRSRVKTRGGMARPDLFSPDESSFNGAA